MTRAARFGRALASLTLLAAIVGGVPWLLACYGDWPITGPPDRDWFDRLGDTAVSDSTVFAALTLAAWAVWAVFVVSVGLEVVAGLRGVQAPRLTIAGPLQRGARVLVVTVLLGLSVHHASQARTAAAGPPFTPIARPASALVIPTTATTRSVTEPPPPALAPAEVSPPLDDSTPDVETPDNGTVGVDATTGETVVLIQRGDSPWSLTERHLGDGTRWHELWERNRDTIQPDGNHWSDPETIHPNWLIRIPIVDQADDWAAPTDPGNSPEAASPAALASNADTPSEAPAEVVHVVVAGDTLWDLAERYLGDPTRYDELFVANQSRPQPDGRHLDDPDIIVPGWQLVIPAPPEPAPAALEPEPEPVEAASAPAPPPDPTMSPPSTTTTTVPATTTPTTATTAARPSNAVSAQHERDGRDAREVVAGVGGAIVLASAIASRVVWLRRRQATRSHHLPSGDVERALLTASDVPLVQWAGQQLAQLVSRLDRRTVTSGPVAVEVSDTAGLEILWEHPQHAAAPSPWTSADGGWAWRLAYYPDEPVAANALPAGIPALATVGRREGRQLLIDLEAYGLVTVSGPDDMVDSFLRSIVFELATGNDLADAFVSTDLDIVTGGSDVELERLSRRPLADTIAQRAASATATDDSQDSFRARVGTAAPIEAVIVVARDPTAEQVETLTEHCRPRSGTVAVLAHASVDAGARIELQADGTAHLKPLGLDFDPVGIPCDTGSQIVDTLDALATLPDEPTGVGEIDLADRRPTPQTTIQHELFDAAETATANGTTFSVDHGIPLVRHDIGNGDTVDDDRPVGELSEADAESIVVHVLGVPSVPARPELRRRELVLVTLLASRDGTLAASAAQDAIWGGTPVEPKTVWNLVARTRRTLGAFDDGQPLMPTTDRTRGLLRLDPRLTSDLRLFVSRLDEARDASSAEALRLLAAALDLVDGPPFDGAGYDWAHRDQDVAYASTAIEQAAELLVDLALDAGRVDLARDGLVNALRGLPGNENLYRLRMRAEHHASNHTAIAAAYDELCVYLADLDSEPSPMTTALFHELTSQRHARSA